MKSKELKELLTELVEGNISIRETIDEITIGFCLDRYLKDQKKCENSIDFKNLK